MQPRSWFFFVLASGFVLLGMSITVPGVTWPAVASSFGRSLADLGYVTLLFGGGYTVSSFLSGRIVGSRGIGAALVMAATASTVALAGISGSAGWPMFLAATGLLGLGGGLVDAATNTYVAMRGGAREMGSIHGIFGLGAISGPLLATALLNGGMSWRVSYAVLAVLQTLYVAALVWSARKIADQPATDRPMQSTAFWRAPVAQWSLIVFFVYAGIGAGAGVWAFTYLTDERGMSVGLSGVIVAAYWGALAASRLLVGAIGERLRPDKVILWSTISTAVAFILLGWSEAAWIGAAALIFAGFSHGPIFPLQMLLTPRRVGPDLTAQTVGYEISAANIGGAILPGLMGLAVGVAGLSVIPTLLVANSFLLIAVAEVLRRQPAIAPEVTPADV